MCVYVRGERGKETNGQTDMGWWETLMSKDLRTAFRSQFFLFTMCASPKLGIHLKVLNLKMRSRLRCSSLSQIDDDF